MIFDKSNVRTANTRTISVQVELLRRGKGRQRFPECVGDMSKAAGEVESERRVK